MMDSNGDGVVSTEEFGSFFRKITTSLSPQQHEETLRQCKTVATTFAAQAPTLTLMEWEAIQDGGGRGRGPRAL